MNTTLLLESASDRRLRLIKEAHKKPCGQRKSNYNSILQTGAPTKVLSLCVYNEQKELERYLDEVRRSERKASDMDDLDQTYNILTEDVL